jgi:hypothetical protein
VCSYVHGPAADDSAGLGPGDLEAALLAGLGKAKRNQAIARFLHLGRPTPTGYALSQQNDRVVVVTAPHQQGGHLWHGRKVVERILASSGPAGLHVRSSSVCSCQLRICRPQSTTAHCAASTMWAHSSCTGCVTPW